MIKWKVISFAFLVSNFSIMPLLAMEGPQLTQQEGEQLTNAILDWIGNSNRSPIEQFVNEHPNLEQLKALDLNNNNIGAEGAQHLANVLPQLTQLRVLDLSNNNIGA